MTSWDNKNCFLASVDKKWPQDRRERSNHVPRVYNQFFEILVEKVVKISATKMEFFEKSVFADQILSKLSQNFQETR